MKKLLAIILATVMVAAMLPVGVVSAADEYVTYNYVFSGAAHKISADAQANNANAITYTNQILIEDTIESVSAPWGVSKQGVKNECNAWEPFFNRWNSVYVRIQNKEMDNAANGYGPRAYIEIDVAKSGTFVPKINAFNTAYFGVPNDAFGRYWEVYLIPTTTEGFQENFEDNTRATKIFTNENLIGILNCSSSYSRENEFAATYLEKGRYYLVIAASGLTPGSGVTADSEGNYDFSLDSLVLTQVPDASVVNKEYDYDFSTAAIKDSVLGEAEAFSLTKNGGETVSGNQNTLSSYDFVDTDASREWALVPGYSAWLSGLSVSRAGGALETQVDAKGLTVANVMFTQRTVLNGIHYNSAYVSSGLCRGDGPNTYFTMKVNVPNPGTYDLYMENEVFDIPGDGIVNVFAVPVVGAASNLYDTYVRGTLDTTGIETGTRPMITTNYVGTRAAETVTEGKVGSFEATVAGDYYVIFEFDTNATVVHDKEIYPNGKSDPNCWESKVETSFTLKNMTLKCTSIPAANAATVAKAAEQAVVAGNPEKDSTVDTAAANINVYKKDVNGAAIDTGIIETISGETAGDSVILSAPAIEGYTFMYWATGLGEKSRPVSTDADYVVKATKGATHISAVYASDRATVSLVEFYDADGKVVMRSTAKVGDAVTAPTLPTSPILGQALTWKSASEAFEDDLASGASFTMPKARVVSFVAEYADATSVNVTIAAAGSEGITGAGTYAFGENVTVVAPARENGSGTKAFAYWKKGDEIVSFDRSYSFVATADATVTAYYQNYKPIDKTVRKVLTSSVVSGTDTIVSAEFIGCDGAIERGFIFGGTGVAGATIKVPMKTNAKSFTMINDSGLTAKAYAIFADGVIYSK